MRISDWSSDVCSSDLRSIATAADHLGRQHLTIRSELHCHGTCKVIRRRRRTDPEFADARSHDLTPIGLRGLDTTLLLGGHRRVHRGLAARRFGGLGLALESFLLGRDFLLALRFEPLLFGLFLLLAQ